MFKAKKQSHKQGTAKRLVRGSFVLSRTRALSAKMLRFFESGAASPLFTSVKKPTISQEVMCRHGSQRKWVCVKTSLLVSVIRSHPSFRVILL